ncbi:hypothetical protein SAMN05216548_102159 [Faunimonas pinastri]|uniref:Uncharacterized protein n=1 Tax=Faunimonas pinastri TaxID=1855383 RepID=A0A1H9CJP3_9HYPH|nr:hypothetical protein [Faunimonas pinastri]SEQ00828.1 hypothetical protein SAMN05216548_102159 [Faunimonas pinastri]
MNAAEITPALMTRQPPSTNPEIRRTGRAVFALAIATCSMSMAIVTALAILLQH